MESITAIGISLALGAGAAAGKDVVDAVVKDAYAKLKELLQSRYPKVPVAHLAKTIESSAVRTSLENELAGANADQDPEVIAAAADLINAVRNRAPSVAVAIGVDLSDLEGASLRLTNIAAAGTGVKVHGAKITGDIDISGVRAGLPNTEEGID